MNLAVLELDEARSRAMLADPVYGHDTCVLWRFCNATVSSLALTYSEPWSSFLLNGPLCHRLQGTKQI